MILRRGLIGLVGLIMAGCGWDVMAADRGPLDQALQALSSPLKPAPEQIMTPKGMIRPEAMPLTINRSLLEDLRRKAPGTRLEIGQVVLEPGMTVSLDVTRVEPFSPGAQVVLMESDGKGGVREKMIAIPDQVILAGRVVGQPESRVVLAIAEQGCNGYFSTESGLYLVASPADTDGPPVIYPVGQRAGAIDLVPKYFPVGVKDEGVNIEPPPPPALDRIIGGNSHGDSRSNREADRASRCCIQSAETDYNIYGQPDDWEAFPVADEAECLDLNGIWHSSSWSSSNCNATYSTHITGACCLRPMDTDEPPGVSMCVQRTLEDCEALNGLFAGYRTKCSEGLCVSYGLECFHATIGIDTDDEFLLVFNGDVQKAINYIALLVGASSQIFDDNIRLKFKIRAIRLWTAGIDPWSFDDFEVDFQDIHDPYTSGTEDTIIQEVRDLWEDYPPPGAEPINTLHAVHMLSGQSLGYGYVSQLGGLCIPNDLVTGITSGIHGSFPYPVVDFHPDNWDLMFFTQVMGRMAGARYTHQYTEDSTQHPVYIDRCGSLYQPLRCDFPVSFPPSLMSFCYRCEGGVSNISMQFHPYVRGEMFKRILQSPCIFYDYPNVMAVDDIGFTVPGLPVRLDVLANDRSYECSPITDSAAIPFLDIDTQDSSSEPLDDYPRTTPLGGYITTTPDPGSDLNNYGGLADNFDRRMLRYTPPCELFEGWWPCPTGNSLQNWTANDNGTAFIDSFSYRANMNGTDSVAGKNDNATVRVVVSPPPMSWPSACLAGIDWKPGSTDPDLDENRISFDLSIDVPINPRPNSGPRQPYDVAVLAFGYLNLNSNTTFLNSNGSDEYVTNSEGVCFELYVNDVQQSFNINGTNYPQLCPWDPVQDVLPQFRNGNCGSYVFDEFMPLNTNGDIRVDVVWNTISAITPPPEDKESNWFDGRVYVQIDDNFGACCLPDSSGIVDPDCQLSECMSASACVEMGGIFLGRGSARPGLPGEPPLQACALVEFGACQFGTPSSPSYFCECRTQVECQISGGTYLGSGEPCPEIPGVPKGPACLTFDQGACCFVTECEMVDFFDNTPYTAETCEIGGGVFRGPGSSCEINYEGDTPGNNQTICSTDPPLAFGACCLPDEDENAFLECNCAIVTQTECLDNYGIWQEYWDAPSLGGNTHCFKQTCNGEYHFSMCFNENATHEGACCLSTTSFPDGGCLLTNRETCWDINGGFFGFQGDGIPCGAGLCDVGSTGLGACCLSSGACINRTQADCDAAPGNTVFYPGLLCNGTDCPYEPDITGACCLASGGLCLDDRTQQECLQIQGTFQGENTSCANNTDCIDGTQGSCCVPLSHLGVDYDYCIEPFNESACNSLGGTWLTDDYSCVDRPCGIEAVCCVGDICYPDYIVDEDDCEDEDGINGTWKEADNSPCESGVCLGDDSQANGLRGSCDINRDGAEDVSDFLIIIQNYGQRGGRGDFNRDGTVTVDDILDYLVDCP